MFARRVAGSMSREMSTAAFCLPKCSQNKVCLQLTPTEVMREAEDMFFIPDAYVMVVRDWILCNLPREHGVFLSTGCLFISDHVAD